MNKINLSQTFGTDNAPAPHDPRGSDYETRWRACRINGKDVWVPDENGAHVQRNGQWVRVSQG